MQLRRLAEVRAAGDEVWFRPALDTLRQLPHEPDSRLHDYFSATEPLYVARAPGRLDVMGGIADYSGALVLELPLARSTSVCLQPQDAPRCDVVSRRDGRWHFFSVELEPLLAGPLREPDALAAWFADRPSHRWAAYPVGVVARCLALARGGDSTAHIKGVRLLIDSTVPEGKGVSSSAALEVATMAVTAAWCGIAMTPEALATACQWVENHIVGAPCGIMDQMTSACGRTDRLLRLRCQPATIEGHLEIPPGYRCYGIDSGVRHAVSGADYGTVRTAAFIGYRLIADAAGLTVTSDGSNVRIDDPVWRGYLTNLTPAEFTTRYETLLPDEMLGATFLEQYGGTTDRVTCVEPERRYPVRRATAHPVFEQDRIARFAGLLDALPQRPQSAIELGHLMYASHESYGACGLGSDGTDRLVTLVAAAGVERGLFGAKITGGGSGGTVAILATDAAEPLVGDIAAQYAAETGRSAEVFAESGPGAAATGVLLIEPNGSAALSR